MEGPEIGPTIYDEFSSLHERIKSLESDVKRLCEQTERILPETRSGKMLSLITEGYNLLKILELLSSAEMPERIATRRRLREIASDEILTNVKQLPEVERLLSRIGKVLKRR